jgi:hypothetical protein
MARRAARGASTPVKFALGLLQLGLGFAALWLGAEHADARGMVAVPWLLLGYLLHTTGELCVSPVGLSMVTRLSPARLVSTLYGRVVPRHRVLAVSRRTDRAAHGRALRQEGAPAVPDSDRRRCTCTGTCSAQIAVGAVISALACFAIAPPARQMDAPRRRGGALSGRAHRHAAQADGPARRRKPPRLFPSAPHAARGAGALRRAPPSMQVGAVLAAAFVSVGDS